MSHIDLGRERQNAVLDWLHRLPVLTRQHVECLVPSLTGRTRSTNAALKALADRKALHAFQVAGGLWCYSLRRGPTDKTPHALAIADVFCALRRTAPAGVTVEGAAEVVLSPQVRADALILAESLAVLVEVHRATNSFGTKFERYRDLDYKGLPWYRPGLKIALWVVTVPSAVSWIEQRAQPFRAGGMTIRVSPLERAARFGWRELELTPAKAWAKL